MDHLVVERHQRFSTDLSLRLSFKKFHEGEIELAIHHAEEAIKAMQEIKATKKPTDSGMSIDQ